jgi:hypothetical protein
MSLELDTYSRKARLMPVLLLFLPIGLTIAGWPGTTLGPWGPLMGLFTPFGLMSLLPHLGRDMGKKKEPKLYGQWGGKPTVRFLRHADSGINSVTKALYHLKLEKMLPDLRVPTPEMEAAEPDKADGIYEAYGNYLIARTRDSKVYQLLFAENVSYGFRRNLWAMRPVGITIALIGLFACAGKLIADAGQGAMSMLLIVATTLNAVLLVLWVVRIKSEWVRLAAEEYAKRLLETLTTLEPPAVERSKLLT